MKYVIGISVGFAVLFLIAGGAIPLWMGVRSAWRGLTCSRWPTAAGLVLNAAVDESEAERRPGKYTLETYTFYLPRLTFGYRVVGREYATENLQFGRAVGSGDASEAALLMLRYPPGVRVPVHYHPTDPSLAVVRTGVHSDIVWYFVAGLAFILFGAVAALGYLSTVAGLPFGRVMSLMWVIFIMLGIGMLTPGLINLRRAKASENWPTTDGTIVVAQEQTDTSVVQSFVRGIQSTVTHGVPLAYEYEVRGEMHYANVRHFGQFVGSSEESWSDLILRRYPTGTRVPVTYDPADPDVAALEPGINPEAWFLPGGGAAFLLFGSLALFLSLRR